MYAGEGSLTALPLDWASSFPSEEVQSQLLAQKNAWTAPGLRRRSVAGDIPGSAKQKQKVYVSISYKDVVFPTALLCTAILCFALLFMFVKV